MSTKEELLKQIQSTRETSNAKKKFSGTLMDYIDKVEQDPSLVKSSHKRLYESVVEHGVYDMPDSDSRKYKIFDSESLKIYKYFERRRVSPSSSINGTCWCR